jgi:hypothetical protein
MLLARIKVEDTLNLGDLLVGVGTLALAGFTYRLARVTRSLDTRVAEREQRRRERRLRGVARLMAAELTPLAASIEMAIDTREWQLYWDTTHPAWDRDAGVIVEALDRKQAGQLIGFFSHLSVMKEGWAALRVNLGATGGEPLTEQKKEGLTELKGELATAQEILWRLGYLGEHSAVPQSSPGNFLWIARWAHTPDMSTIQWLKQKGKKAPA